MPHLNILTTASTSLSNVTPINNATDMRHMTHETTQKKIEFDICDAQRVGVNFF